MLSNSTVLVTGAAGSIGSEICKKLLEMGVYRLKCYDNSEYGLYRLSQKINDDERVRYLLGDIRDPARLERAVFGSDYIVHAAALKHVKFCEFNPDEAFKTNVIGTQNVIDSCRKANVEHCILISTDKAVKPTSVMGTTKSLAEKIFMNAPDRNNNEAKFTVVRFGNVFGSAGSVIETFYNQIRKNSEMTITHEDISRYFMSISEACDLVLECFEKSEGEKIFILKMKKAKILDIARRMMSTVCPEKEFKYKVIGMSAGEKFDEVLVDQSEIENCIEDEKFFIISKKPQSKTVALDDSFMTNKEIDILINNWIESRNL